MRLLPVSLAARTVLLVIAIVAVAEMATFSLIFHHDQMTHVSRTVQYISGQIRLLQTVLPGLGPEARKQLSDTDVGEQWLQLRPDGEFVPGHESRPGFASNLENELKRVLGEPVSLRHAGSNHRSGLWIGFMAGNERWWLVLPAPRFKPQALPNDLWLWLSGTLVFLVIIAGIFVRSIVGPLSRLGEAVSATGDGSARMVMPEGPKEVQRLAERHNTMVQQLAATEAERREMLAGLTHDLRAPLARLRVRLALLASDEERAGLARDTDDMERIVGQCLAFLQSEETSTHPAPLLLFADAVSNEVARHHELGRPVSMVVDDDAIACRVAISSGNVQRILDNLIGNALQHGIPPIEISLSVPREGKVVLQVRDHGQGISPEQRDHALEAFAQINPARTTSGSCGLGLAIVRRIVAGSGGEIRLGEATSGGLEVTMSFPAQVELAHNI